jgi:protein TonB
VKPQVVISFLAAACFHSMLLFGIKVSKAAQPFAMSNEPENVQVDLVDASPEPPPAEPPPAEPPPPEPVPEMPQPAEPPSPEPTPVEQHPEPVPEPKPEPQVIPEKPAQTTPIDKPPPPRHVEKPRGETHAPKPSVTPHDSPHGIAGAGTNAKPRYRTNPAPDYPAEARRLKQQGVVVLSVAVSAQGRPTSVKLSRGSGFPTLDKAALDAVSRWTFEPAQTAGLPVASHIDVPVRFSLVH